MSDEGYKPPKNHSSHPSRAARSALVPPIDQADAEAVAAMAEKRPVDFEAAFPRPPAPVSSQIEDELMSDHLIPSGETEVFLSSEPLTRGRDPLLPDEVSPPPMPVKGQGPRQRLQGVENKSSNYLQEYKLKILHRLLMRNLPLDMIAAQLNMSTREVQTMRRELERRLAYEAQTINRYEIAGKTMAFYDEVQGMALRMADNTEFKPYVRIQALQAALGSQADRQRFLTASGFWGAAPFSPNDLLEDEGSRAASKIHTLIEAIIDSDGTAVMDIEATTQRLEDDETDVNLI